jgi:hypothetical protein
MHLQRRRELHEKEIDTCLEKLDEIKTKLDKGRKNFILKDLIVDF